MNICTMRWQISITRMMLEYPISLFVNEVFFVERYGLDYKDNR